MLLLLRLLRTQERSLPVRGTGADDGRVRVQSIRDAACLATCVGGVEQCQQRLLTRLVIPPRHQFTRRRSSSSSSSSRRRSRLTGSEAGNYNRRPMSIREVHLACVVGWPIA